MERKGLDSAWPVLNFRHSEGDLEGRESAETGEQK